MKKNSSAKLTKQGLSIFYGIWSGFTEVAGLAVCVLKNRVKRGANKLFLGLIRGENRGYWGAEKAIGGIISWDFMNVHFAEYSLRKVKKANSLYVIIRKE